MPCLIIFLILLSGCTCGRESPISMPSSVIEEAVSDSIDDPLIDVDAFLPADWWTLFNDPQLNEFIQIVFTQNQTLKQAELNIYSAKISADRFRSALFPTLLLGGDISRAKLSETGLIPFTISNDGNSGVSSGALPAPGGSLGIPVYYTQYETELNLQYDFDIWNKRKNTWKAGLDRFYASQLDTIFTRLELGIAVAKLYYSIQVGYKRLEIANELLENQTKYLNLVKTRIKNNLDNNVSLINAEVSVAQAIQAVEEIDRQIQVNEIQFRSYLGGQMDELLANIHVENVPLPKVPIPKDIHLNLIAHRPDIVSQLWILEAAGKEIEVAKAGFYPDFTLGSIFGYQTLHMNELFRYPSIYYNVDPAMSLPLFDAGLLLANLHGSEIQYDLAIYEYNQLILDAVKEVLSELTNLKNFESQLSKYQEIAKNQDKLLNLTKLKIEHHLSSDLDLLISERNRWIARDQEMVALGNEVIAILSLIKALGGGFETELCWK